MTMTVEERLTVFIHDGWLCHICRGPLVFDLALRQMQQWVSSEFPGRPFAYWDGAGWPRMTSPMLDDRAAMVDHSGSVPRSVCARCRSRKGDKSTADYLAGTELYLPKKDPTDWDGMASVFVLLASQDEAALNDRERESLRVLQRWLEGAAI